MSKVNGNFVVGTCSIREAYTAGEKWLGPSYRISSNGKAWISKDGTKQFRPPTLKTSGKIQANFQAREGNLGAWTKNGHMDIE